MKQSVANRATILGEYIKRNGATVRSTVGASPQSIGMPIIRTETTRSKRPSRFCVGRYKPVWMYLEGDIR